MISLGSKLGLVSLGLSIAFFGCGKTSDNEANAASGAPGAGKAGELNEVAQLETGGVGNAGSGGAFGGIGGMPAQPVVPCGQGRAENAGAAGANEECSLPPSVCADGRRLVYYSAGACDAGACTWATETLECPERCTNGACVGSTTEK